MIEWWNLFWTDARTFTATLFAIPIFGLFAIFVYGLWQVTFLTFEDEPRRRERPENASVGTASERIRTDD